MLFNILFLIGGCLSSGVPTSNHLNKEDTIQCGLADEFLSKWYYSPDMPWLTYTKLNDLPTCGTPRIWEDVSEARKLENVKPRNEKPITHEKIFGGFSVDSSASFPWIASLREQFNKFVSKHICGAAILSERFVLTAAHCVGYKNHTDNHALIIRVGEYAQDIKEGYEQDFNVEAVVSHKTSCISGDIAVIKIKPKSGHGIIFNHYVTPVCLPSLYTPYWNITTAMIGGWGNTEERTISNTLLLAEVPLVNPKKCRKLYREYDIHCPEQDHIIGNGLMCAGQLEGISDACEGDSGGPMVANINDRGTLLGLVSTGLDCAKPNFPGIYADVQYYLKWIMDTMQELCN